MNIFATFVCMFDLSNILFVTAQIISTIKLNIISQPLKIVVHLSDSAIFYLNISRLLGIIPQQISHSILTLYTLHTFII